MLCVPKRAGGLSTSRIICTCRIEHACRTTRMPHHVARFSHMIRHSAIAYERTQTRAARWYGEWDARARSWRAIKFVTISLIAHQPYRESLTACAESEHARDHLCARDICDRVRVFVCAKELTCAAAETERGERIEWIGLREISAEFITSPESMSKHTYTHTRNTLKVRHKRCLYMVVSFTVLLRRHRDRDRCWPAREHVDLAGVWLRLLLLLSTSRANGRRCAIRLRLVQPYCTCLYVCISCRREATPVGSVKRCSPTFAYTHRSQHKSEREAERQNNGAQIRDHSVLGESICIPSRDVCVDIRCVTR